MYGVTLYYLILLLASFKVKAQSDRPRLETSDGHLVIEPAYGKNIYLRPNGPGSTVFAGSTNLLLSNVTKLDPQVIVPTLSDFGSYLNGPNGILNRLNELERRESHIISADLQHNISRLYSRVTRLSTRLTRLQQRLIGTGRECLSRPCRNGGTCLELLTGYHCLCSSYWEGTDCDLDVNECRAFAGTELGCQNGGTCVNRPGSYECLCPPNFYGLHCTQKQHDCTAGNMVMCGYGTCLEVNAGYKCLCDPGWTTDITGNGPCNIDVNECAPGGHSHCSINPRVECINLPGSFRCGACPSGYEGDGTVCYDIDECLVDNGGCSNLVACHNTIGSRICGPCPTGYMGDGTSCIWQGTCEENNGGCHPSARCSEMSGASAPLCSCPDGMEGDGYGFQGCYVSTNATLGCNGSPCGLRGRCHRLAYGYTCICEKGYGGSRCELNTLSCTPNPCLNDGLCHSDNNSARGFRCECKGKYSGELCESHHTICGSVIDAQEGNIVYPQDNTTYEHNERCAWVLHTLPDRVINVTFTAFDLESSNPNGECAFDFLQIHDGRNSASQLIGRFCGNVKPKDGNIVSSHNNLYFWFRSDSSVKGRGFALHWSSILPVCGGDIDARVHGHISSPGSPGNYPPGRDCYWHLKTDMGKRIQLNFYELDIESHVNCSFDWLALYDGEHETDPLLARYCNSSQPAPIMSAGSEILVHFHSDQYGTGKGFQIAFSSTEGIPGCGGYFTTDKGDISSPSYGERYLDNLLCEYKIQTAPDTKIRINFHKFRLEPSVRCRSDYLSVYDGLSSESPLVGKFCGSTAPKSYTSSNNKLFLKFKSDPSVSFEGFKITYETICQYTLFGDSGFIKSPGYPLPYPSDRECNYIIISNPGKAIKLKFQDFDIEDNTYYACQYDFVEIHDGPNSNAPLLGHYCGGVEHIPPTLISTHNYMHILFKSDMSVSGYGFYANYTTIDTVCGGVYRDLNGTINHPSENGNLAKYENDQFCSWILLAPEGMIIQVTWNRFDLEKILDCRGDYVELIEVDQNNQNSSLGKYCGTYAPALTTTSNQLLIRFESDKSIKASGFSLSYVFLNESSICGGRYLRDHGLIHSPGWPKKYPNNRDCTWIITVPAGQQIALNISHFDLERPIHDSCDLGDYLEIRNGASSNSSLVNKICGNFKSRKIISLSNSIYLHFHSDYYLTGNGFQIEWDGTISGCGGTLTSSSGSISSPNYPLEYHNDAECFYRIVVNPGSRIRIDFVELDLEQQTDCFADYVEVFDGRSSEARSMGKFCQMSKHISLLSKDHQLFIKFRSDSYLGGKGFLLTYISLCQANVSGSYGVIESPGYPNNYQRNLDCLWTISVAKGNKINITFTHFDIYKSIYFTPTRYPNRTPTAYAINRNCEKDFVQMRDLSDSDFTNKYCGLISPRPVTSKTSSFQIKFVTESYFPRSGFRLEWVRYGCGGHLQKSYGVIKIDKSLTNRGDLECEWLIEVQLGLRVSLTFKDIHMEDSVNCTTDVIEIYNGGSSESQSITNVCHTKDISVQSTTNFMFVRFRKNSSLRDVYFEAFFNAEPYGCGSRMRTFRGSITSKNYPKNYDNDINCIWSIEVPRHHRVKLNFIDFDLYDETCDDNVKVYNSDIYHYQSQNYSARFCSNKQITPFVSNSNAIIVQFSTDYYGTAKGFKANFSTICGGIVEAQYGGTISFKKDSSTESSCIWYIVSEKLEQKISLTLTHMSIPRDGSITTGKHCQSSYLRVLNGNDENGTLIDEYCGKKVPPMIVSIGSFLTVMFGTYTGILEGSFTAHYTTISSACGGSFTSQEGSISSPNYPRPYPVHSDCEWTLNTSPGNRVYVIFEDFDLENSINCNEDYLEIRENDGAGKLLGVYCGNTVPTTTTIASKMYLKFHSDSDNLGKGFLLHYGFLHGNDIIGKDQGEIASPLYPMLYEGSGEYIWRVTLNGTDSISINIDRLDIPSYENECTSSLSIYDGYDETGPLLDQLCGMVASNDPRAFLASSSIVFIKLTLDESNKGSLFHLRWSKTERAETNPLKACGGNGTQNVPNSQSVEFHSPNYPQDYKNNLNCTWKFKTLPGYHLRLAFTNFELEETPSCYADYVSVYSSDSGLRWQAEKENICLASVAQQKIDSKKRFLKIVFISDLSINKQGFVGKASSVCGGIINDVSGYIGPTWLDYVQDRRKKLKCQWVLKVRPGRVIKAHFENFNITNSNDRCNTFVIIHNGESEEAPLLNKYCGGLHENRSDLISSTNAFLVSYEKSFGAFQSFKLRFEEKSIECGGSSKLDSDHNSEIISSPNYPSISEPYSECIWDFTAPAGEILRIDFIDRFDVDSKVDCSSEYIEIHDGSSQAAPLLGTFCYKNPGTIKTTNNRMYVKFLTQLAVPRGGFKANVSIDICGGTIIAQAGEVTSPGYPHMLGLKPGSICEWHIISMPSQIIKIKSQEISLPIAEEDCMTNITILEYGPSYNNYTVLKVFCSDNYDYEDENLVVETFANKVTIKLFIGKKYDLDEDRRGFRLTFNSSRPLCGGSISSSEGYITSPGYPRESSIRYCQWLITVPEHRRITLDILDSNNNDKQRIWVYNDLLFQSLIDTLNSRNLSGTRLESSGNKMAIFVTLALPAMSQKLKAKFSSDGPDLCGGNLINDELDSPALNRSYYCVWHYSSKSDSLNSTNTKTILVTGTISSSGDKNRCRYGEPKLSIVSHIHRINYFHRDICGNKDFSYRVPSSAVEIRATQNKATTLNFHLDMKINPCGGVIHASEETTNILNIPSNFTGTIDCAWFVLVPEGNRIELKLDGWFQLPCSQEILNITQGYIQRTMPFASYCNSSAQAEAIETSFSTVFIEYHSMKNNSYLKLFVKTVRNQCGGKLYEYESVFSSPNYPKTYLENKQECSWDINSRQGDRISLRFWGRFMIEEQPNCTKDVVMIYDWVDDKFVEMARLCGRNLPQIYNSTYNRMKVVLRIEGNSNSEGFRARWEPICGGNYLATNQERFLYSPGYPEDYRPFSDCTYKISARNQKIQIKFHEFEMEGTYPECEYDNLTISTFDFSDYEAVYVDDIHSSYRFDSLFCGSEKPPDMVESNEIMLNFKSDRYIQRRGFKLSYSVYSCGGEVTTPRIITSGSGERYIENLNCTWSIIAPSNQIVVIKFIFIDLEHNFECRNDYLAVFNGLFIDAKKRLAILCGHRNLSIVLRSNNNKMLLQFVTDSSVELGGFRAEVSFTLSESIGCGGLIDLKSMSTKLLKSPLINNSAVYENFLDCDWRIVVPIDKIVKIEFISFHIASCYLVNQTALGFSKCDCDFVEIKDGIGPDGTIIGKYCGHQLPPVLTSTSNELSVRLYTDGELDSGGFEARLSVTESSCGETYYTIKKNIITHFETLGYGQGSIARGIRCVYTFVVENNVNEPVRVSIKDLDLLPPSPDYNKCLDDKVTIQTGNRFHRRNTTIGKGLIFAGDYETTANVIELCGTNHFADYYLYDDVVVTIQTAPSSLKAHRGVKLDVSFEGYCGRNYTELQGRMMSIFKDIFEPTAPHDCYTLITVPDNYTISVYFISLMPTYVVSEYIDIYDGNSTKAMKLLRITGTDENEPNIFSNSNSIMLHQHWSSIGIGFDLNYVATMAGRGCGGKLFGQQGRITSPLYPNPYRRHSACEWELEVSRSKRLKLIFLVFDLGRDCEHNYVTLVDSKGHAVSSYCDESPAEYISEDNYVKIVFNTNMNNGGTGWVATFATSVEA